VNAAQRERCREAREFLGRAQSDLSSSSGNAWELDLASVYDQLSASHNGDYADILRSAPQRVDEALRRGRVWTAAMLSGISGMPAWMVDGPAAYRRQLAEVASFWKPRAAPLWPDYQLWMAEALLDLYEDQPERGLERLERRQASLARERRGRQGRRVSAARVGLTRVAGRCAAAALAAGFGERSALAASLRRACAVLAKDGRPASGALATLFEGALEHQLGDAEQAVVLLRSALGGFELAGMGMFAAAARRRLGQLVAGDEGRALVERAEDFMHAEGVDDLDAETHAHCPGYAERAATRP